MRDQEKVGGMVAQIERKLTREEQKQYINMLVQIVCSGLGFVSKPVEYLCFFVPKVAYVTLNYIA